MINSKKRILSIFIILIMIFANCTAANLSVEAAGGKESKKPTKITLNYKKKNLSVGETVTLKVKTVKPSGASKSVTWSSSDKKIATVSTKGKMKAKETGNVTITARSKISNKVVAKCKIKVYKATKKLKLTTKKSYTLAVGETQKLSAKVTKPKKGAAPVEWSSANKNIAKVSKTGKVTAVSQGVTTITAKSGKKKVKTKIKVVINQDHNNQEGNQSQNGGVASEESSVGSKTPENTTSGNTTTGNTNGTTETGKTEQDSTDNPDADILYSDTWNGMAWSLDEAGKLVISGTDTSDGTTSNELPKWCTYSEHITTAVVTAESVKSTYGWFYGCSNLTNVDFSKFDTNSITNMGSMFMGCSSLTTIDVTQFDTSHVTDMSCMFAGCSSLANVDVSKFSTGNVTDMSGMFWLCSSLSSVNISGFDTNQVTNMESMFENCNSLATLDLSNFDTANVTDMGFLFSGCNNLASLDVSKFNTQNVTDMRGMFQNCSSLTCLDVTNFNTGKVTDMGYMFSCCNSLTSVDTSGFDTSQVTDMEFMFQSCDNLQQ